MDQTLVNTCEAIGQQVRAFRASFLGGSEWEECRKRVLLGTNHAVRVFLIDALHTMSVWHALILPAVYRELLDELVLDEVAELFDGVPRATPAAEAARAVKANSAASDQSASPRKSGGKSTLKASARSELSPTSRRPPSPVPEPEFVSPPWRDAIEGRIGLPRNPNTGDDPNETTTAQVRRNGYGYSGRQPYDEPYRNSGNSQTPRPAKDAKDSERPSSGACVLL